GSDGQDGRLLYGFLLKKQYTLLGIDKETIKSHGIPWTEHVDINNSKEVFQLLKTIKPDEIYYLAAFHQSSEDKPIDEMYLFHQSYKINVFSLMNFLEAIKTLCGKTKIFYASSSHIFCCNSSNIQDENTPFSPNSIYGITKLDGLLLCRYYRNKYGIFTSSGILYNHESHLRKETFLSKKIIKGAIDIKNKKCDRIVLGDLSAKSDWGYASDYIEAMYKILNINSADDFIIATGQLHTVLEFVDTTFTYLGLKWENHIEENKHIINRKNNILCGNHEKLTNATGWKPKVNFKEMIKILLINEGWHFDEK
ncbi:MAG: GDP-mannose 4,6-dehydratase, partial [Candidatus Eremiobacterota bacterium]